MIKTLNEVFDKTETFSTYRNRIIERINSKSFRVGKNYYPSVEDAKAGVDQSIVDLNQSINRR